MPVSYDDTVVASVIAIHDEEYDFEAGDPSAVDGLRESGTTSGPTSRPASGGTGPGILAPRRGYITLDAAR
jgi:hypothetical protein